MLSFSFDSLLCESSKNWVINHHYRGSFDRREEARSKRNDVSDVRPTYEDEKPAVANIDDFSAEELSSGLLDHILPSGGESKNESENALSSSSSGVSPQPSKAVIPSERENDQMADVVEKETGKHVYRKKRRKVPSSASEHSSKSKQKKHKAKKTKLSLLSFDLE